MWAVAGPPLLRRPPELHFRGCFCDLIGVPMSSRDDLRLLALEGHLRVTVHGPAGELEMLRKAWNAAAEKACQEPLDSLDLDLKDSSAGRGPMPLALQHVIFRDHFEASSRHLRISSDPEEGFSAALLCSQEPRLQRALDMCFFSPAEYLNSESRSG